MYKYKKGINNTIVSTFLITEKNYLAAKKKKLELRTTE